MSRDTSRGSSKVEGRRAGSRVAFSFLRHQNFQFFVKAAEAPEIEHFLDMNSVQCSPYGLRASKGCVDEETRPGEQKQRTKQTVCRMRESGVVERLLRGDDSRVFQEVGLA